MIFFIKQSKKNNPVGILNDSSVSIDATHVEANTIKKTPERLMKHLARKIIKTYSVAFWPVIQRFLIL
ncbi:hypothetical protein GH807_10810 [Acetobacterium tundrae]|uniref:Transposase n=1 Tax=Acetobacterium tundrae TaxID=132932 RepID=A0ABR6WLZ3_9FIRM|nr:hypothetical protein [Acetobacterium tundrae]